jgi:general secretion pathway protein I
MHKLAHHAHLGFTLVEVMVALVIAAIALSAVARSVMQSTDTTIVLRDRQMALWVAQNRMAEVQLSRAWPPLDTTDGSEELGGKHWSWTQKVVSTPEPMLRRVEIVVRDKSDSGTKVDLVHFFRIPSRVTR